MTGVRISPGLPCKIEILRLFWLNGESAGIDAHDLYVILSAYLEPNNTAMLKTFFQGRWCPIPKGDYPFHIPSVNPAAKLEANGRRVIIVERKPVTSVRDVEIASMSFP